MSSEDLLKWHVSKHLKDEGNSNVALQGQSFPLRGTSGVKGMS